MRRPDGFVHISPCSLPARTLQAPLPPPCQASPGEHLRGRPIWLRTRRTPCLFCVLVEIVVGPREGKGWPISAPLDPRADCINNGVYQTPLPWGEVLSVLRIFYLRPGRGGFSCAKRRSCTPKFLQNDPGRLLHPIPPVRAHERDIG